MKKSVKFIFLILPEVHLLDLAGADQVISEAIDFGADFRIEYCGIEPAIKTSAGLGIPRLKHFSKIKYEEGDFIIIPGTRVRYILSKEFKENKQLFQWLAKTSQNKAHLVSICVGAFVLAEAGLLNHRECTTHFQLTKKLQDEFPGTNVRENVLFISEGNLHTSAGIASGIDLMLHIVEKITDSHFAHKVGRELVVYNRRDGSAAQESDYFNFRNHVHYAIHKVQDYLTATIHKKQRLSILANLAAMSERNFTRVFKKETGISVNEYVNTIRVARLKELMNSPDLSRKQIAKKLGLESEKQVDRLLKRVG